MITIGIVVLIFGLNLAGGPSAAFNSPHIPTGVLEIPGGFLSIGTSTVLLWFASSIPGSATNQIYYQRICSIKNPDRVNLSLLISGVAVLEIGIWATSLGVTIRSLNPDLKSGQETTGWLMTQMPLGLLILFGSLVCAAIMSTASSARKKLFTGRTIFKSMIASMIACVIARSTDSFGTVIPFTLFGVAASILTMLIGSQLDKKRTKQE